MSWDQGVQDRADLPAKFIAFAEQAAREQGIDEPLDYVSWYDKDAFCHFGERKLRLVVK